MLNKLRVNLTLLNTLVLTVILIAISIFLYITMSFNIENDVDNDLMIVSSQLSSYLKYLDDIKNGQPPIEEKKDEYSALHNKIMGENISFIIWDQNYNIIDSSYYLHLAASKFKEISFYYFSENQDNKEYIYHDYSYGNLGLRICTFVTVNEGGQVRIIQTIKNLKAESEMLYGLINILFITVLVGISLSFIGGYFLSGRSIIPVKNSLERQQEFIADASHELRTPLAVVQTNLEVVRSSIEDKVKDQINWLNNAYDETIRMQNIVNDLLFLARVDAGQMLLEKEEVDIGFIIKDVTEKMLTLSMKKQIQIFDDLDDNLVVLGDYNKLVQLMVILLDNAIKYSPTKTKIRVVGRRNKNNINIKVIDNGIGMCEEDIPKVFDRFYRIDKARSRDQGGTGLGLSISRWIVENHDGSININSFMGKGTTVNMIFPINNNL